MIWVKGCKLFYTFCLFPLLWSPKLRFFYTRRNGYNSMRCKVVMKTSVPQSHTQYSAWRIKPRAYQMKKGKIPAAFSRLLYLSADYLLAVWCPITDSNDYMPESRITAGTGTRDAFPRDQHSWEREHYSNPNRRSESARERNVRISLYGAMFTSTRRLD
jgi:hypothetical protein